MTTKDWRDTETLTARDLLEAESEVEINAVRQAQAWTSYVKAQDELPRLKNTYDTASWDLEVATVNLKELKKAILAQETK